MMLLFPFCVVSLVSAFVDNAAARGDLHIVEWLHTLQAS
jgi:hypothetical protein